eukprot:gene57741-79110_t
MTDTNSNTSMCIPLPCKRPTTFASNSLQIPPSSSRKAANEYSSNLTAKICQYSGYCEST